MNDLILRAGSFSDVGMTVLIWLVQLVIYPAYHAIDRDRFVVWHHQYVRTISFIVIPLMFVQGGVSIFQCLENPGIVQIIKLMMIVSAWIVTFTLSVPCHNELQKEGWNTASINRLIHTNRIRTVAWTGAMIIGWFAI